MWCVIGGVREIARQRAVAILDGDLRDGAECEALHAFQSHRERRDIGRIGEEIAHRGQHRIAHPADRGKDLVNVAARLGRAERGIAKSLDGGKGAREHGRRGRADNPRHAARTTTTT